MDKMLIGPYKQRLGERRCQVYVDKASDRAHRSTDKGAYHFELRNVFTRRMRHEWLRVVPRTQ
jgi:hypothetical protein